MTRRHVQNMSAEGPEDAQAQKYHQPTVSDGDEDRETRAGIYDSTAEAGSCGDAADASTDCTGDGTPTETRAASPVGSENDLPSLSDLLTRLADLTKGTAVTSDGGNSPTTTAESGVSHGETEIGQRYTELAQRFHALFAWGEVVKAVMTVAGLEIEKLNTETKMWKENYDQIARELEQLKTSATIQFSACEDGELSDLKEENALLKRHLAEFKDMKQEMESVISETKAHLNRAGAETVLVMRQRDETLSSLARSHSLQKRTEGELDVLTDKLDKVRSELNDLKAKAASE